MCSKARLLIEFPVSLPEERDTPSQRDKQGVAILSFGLWHNGVPDPSPSVWGVGVVVLILERMIEKQRVYDGATHPEDACAESFGKAGTSQQLRREAAASWGRSWIATRGELTGSGDRLRVTRKARPACQASLLWDPG